jgi:hypothetical protein
VKPRWSPDGTQIAFTVSFAGSVAIYTIAASGGVPRLIHNDSSLITDGLDVINWSRDGNWIYFPSGRSGEAQTWKVPANGGAAIQVTASGGLTAVESSDGNFIYYLKRAPPSLWRVPIGGGEEVRVMDTFPSSVELVETGLYFSRRQSPTSPFTLRFFRFATGAVTPVAEIDAEHLNAFSLSPDGRTLLLYHQTESGGVDLMFVRRFR